MRKVWTDEVIAYLREIAPGRLDRDTAKLINAKFGLGCTEKAIATIKSKKGIKSGTIGKYGHSNRMVMTKEQREWLRQNIKGVSNAEMVQTLKAKFGLNLTELQLEQYKTNHKIKCGRDTRFQKGQYAHNKGQKMSPEVYEKVRPNMFKKGQKPKKTLPIGSERVRKSGYIVVKRSETECWVLKQVVVWEEAHGRRVPKGYNVIFADRNNRNFDIDNLVLVSNAELGMLNVRHYISEDGEATKTGLLCVRLMNKVAELKKKG